MEAVIRILHLEDDPIDCEMVANLLRREGLAVEVERVDTMQDFRQALQGDCYSLILSDYTVPGMNTLESFALARQRCPEVPFIFLSGTIGEEAAIEALKLGASDYVLKQKMERLVPAVRRALREAQEQSRRQQAEEALRRSEQRLRESEERFREAFAHAPVGMTITDLKGHFLEVNQAYCRMLGYEEQELLRPGFAFRDLTHAEDLEQNLEEWRRLLSGEIPAFFFEKRYWRKDGSIVWVRASVTLRRDHRGAPCQVVAIIEDINDRKLAEESLRAAKEAAEEASRVKSEFLATMSHELRTPMTVILGYLEILLQNGFSGEQRWMLQMVENAAHRLLAIIDDILDISRIEERRLKIEERPFEPRRRVAQVVELFSVQARERKLTLNWMVAERVPQMLRGDPDRIGQVLMNLIGNAVKFTEQGEITVIVDRLAEGISFTVQDTGIGIPAENLEQIFAPFSQVDSSLTRRFGGTGLGLAISRELVTLMGGTIRAESEEGLGSTFRFVLPLPAVEPQ
jgi:PAS domain S-box-containing protein